MAGRILWVCRAARRMRPQTPAPEPPPPRFAASSSALPFRHHTRRLDSHPHRERQMLEGMDALGARDHQSRDNAEANLAQHEPAPFDARVEHRIDDFKRSVK